MAESDKIPTAEELAVRQWRLLDRMEQRIDDQVAERVIDVMGSVTTEVRDLKKTSDKLAAFGRHNRWAISVALIALLIHVPFTYLAVHTGHQAQSATKAVAKQAVSQHEDCLNANASRAAILKLWELDHQRWAGILSFFPNDAQSRAFIDTIKASSDKILAQAEATYQNRSCP